jgi:hypothetical protein
MRYRKLFWEIPLLSVLLSCIGCGDKIEVDPCDQTKWPQAKEYEIKLAVRILSSNLTLPGSSDKPEDFINMAVNGTIEKVECNEENTGPVNLGNSYIAKGIDFPAPVDEPKSYWIGHVVYVYEFDNDQDYINLNLSVKITMQDGQSYMCTVKKKISDQDIKMVPYEMYFYILTDVYSDLWVKV